MLDQNEFGHAAGSSIQALRRHLRVQTEERDARFEVAQQNGTLQIHSEERGGKFVVAPNPPLHQVWISALATSFKLDWDAAAGDFILPRTSEALIPLLERLIEECVQG